MFKPLSRKFYARNTVKVAKDLLGKYLVYKKQIYIITETEAYCGIKDKACHASWRKRTSCENLWGQPGHLYVYLTYGIHYMLNIVTEKENYPAAVLIRGIDKVNGPGRLTKFLKIDKSFDGKDITKGDLFICESGLKPKFKTTTRIGVDYGGVWKDKLWRFVIIPK
jgi:DNA-3-methyladenine glycosylase